MATTILETAEDMAWLAEVHAPIAAGYPMAVLHGNEDSPDRVELYARDHHEYRPTVLEPDATGALVVVELCELPDSLPR